VTADRLVRVGRVGRPHGIRGEVTLLPDLDDDRLFTVGSVFSVDGRQDALEIATARRHRQGWLLGFIGVDDRTAAEELRGTVLNVAADDSVPAGHSDLIGRQVRDVDGAVLGAVVAVEPNPAHDILVLEGDVLVPAPFVRSVDDDHVTVEVPEGLLEINDP